MKNGINGNSKDHHNLSSRGRVIIIITLFIFIALLLQGVIYLQGNVFDGVRSYVRGEGLWAKAQKDSVLYLHRYSYSFNEADYQAYLDSIAVTLGDKKARLALSESPPDINKASAGFLQGQNSPLDIDSMIWFFLNFKKVKYLKEAINIWTQGDNKIEELASTAEELRQEIKYSGSPRINSLVLNLETN